MSRCSIIIVTFNGWNFVRECLQALEAELQDGVEVTIVDNGSATGMLSSVRNQFPWANVIEAGRNLGFAAGNNLGIRQTQSDYVLLLNSDVIVRPGFVDGILQPFDVAPRLGSVAATMVFRSNPEVVASAGIDVFTNGLALDRSVGKHVASLANGSPIFGPSAGAAAYRRAALDDVGLFPESFFMYLEDVDLAWRLRLREWDSILSTAAVVEHAYSASSVEGSSFKRRLLARNRIWYMTRCLPAWLLRKNWWRVAAYDLLVMLSAPIRRDGTSVIGRVSAVSGMRQRLDERHAIQSRATASRVEVERWLATAPSPTRLVRLREETRRASSKQS